MEKESRLHELGTTALEELVIRGRLLGPGRSSSEEQHRAERMRGNESIVNFGWRPYTRLSGAAMRCFRTKIEKDGLSRYNPCLCPLAGFLAND